MQLNVTYLYRWGTTMTDMLKEIVVTEGLKLIWRGTYSKYFYQLK